MTEIIGSENCDNSPKNQFVQDLSIAFATQDHEFLLKSVADDIIWHVAGEEERRGKAEFRQSLRGHAAGEVAKVIIHHVVTHGRAGAVNGVMVFEDGQGVEFCDVYEFTSAKGTAVKAITSYRIERS